MDIISQLQEQLNEIAMVSVNTFGTLQRDAPPVRLSNSYPDPLNPNPNPDGPASQPQAPPAPGAPPPAPLPPQAQPQPALDLDEQPKAMSHALVLAAKKFDALVAALPLSSEEDQLKRIQELQASTTPQAKGSPSDPGAVPPTAHQVWKECAGGSMGWSLAAEETVTEVLVMSSGGGWFLAH
ncbi:mediator of RNA polymerase II transcription subunit 21 isoform X2 [Hordeum vulgare subsp. vulgare]|uniref:Mediator of RNA polymerase II transcription subunit 21 n=1 Tax=Hordeum vulgare subsp. vulgare TaxID=112509 RepID=F2EF70_HORVV|nr:mediator of RNA polymerase II transcription subunit 21 isoform X2 [Hordeum vulgare subsp. vulgare]BAK05992.1 predicted protein [Hordeum vulgare subsp. vulgare]